MVESLRNFTNSLPTEGLRNFYDSFMVDFIIIQAMTWAALHDKPGSATPVWLLGATFHHF